MRPAAFVFAALFLPASVAAQEAPIKVGDQVRFWTQQRRTVISGTITEWAVDSFTVSDTWIPLTSVTRLEVHRGQKTSASTVALWTAIGAGGGAVATYGVVGAFCLFKVLVTLGNQGCGGFNDDFIDGVTPLGLVGIGAGVGALVGALIGTTRKTDRWVPVQLDQLRVSFVPQRDGRFGLGLSVRF